MDSGFNRQSIGLFDHLVGEREQRQRNLDAECLGGLEVDHKLLFRWRLQ
jgi:hypothetical protein